MLRTLSIVPFLVAAGCTGADGQDGQNGQNGQDGISTLTNVVSEPAGTNCAAGGVKIESGADLDGNGTLDSAEVDKTQFVCGAGEAQVVKVFDASATGFPATGNAEITMLTAAVTTTTGGEVLAIGSVDIYCTPTECPAGNPAASGYLWISDANNVNAPIAEFDYFFMPPSQTESVTRTARFPIAGAGTHGFNLRGQDLVNAFTFYRPSLTLVFLP